MQMYRSAQHTCPVCGKANLWQPGVIRHRLGTGNYVHVRFVNDGQWYVSLLRDGRALDENGAPYLKGGIA